MGFSKRIAALALVFLALFLPASAQQQAPRLALVIGNAAYATPGWALKNPVNDATLIADRLRALGFTVDPVMNASKARMEQAMAGFAARLRAAGPEAVGVFYYAGHAAEHDGANVLVPVDVRAGTMDELRYQAPPLNFLLRDMARAGNRVNIVVLDACRDLPLPAGTRSGPAGGLAGLDDVPTNILLAYATRAGATAPDNPSETNSVFTLTLAEALGDSAGEPVSVLFETVQARVASATGFSQRPEFRNQLLRAPGFRLQVMSARRVDPELERLRRENEVLRQQRAPDVGTATSPPAVSVQQPPRTDADEVARASDTPAIGAGAGRYDVSPLPPLVREDVLKARALQDTFERHRSEVDRAVRLGELAAKNAQAGQTGHIADGRSDGGNTHRYEGQRRAASFYGRNTSTIGGDVYVTSGLFKVREFSAVAWMTRYQGALTWQVPREKSHCEQIAFYTSRGGATFAPLAEEFDIFGRTDCAGHVEYRATFGPFDKFCVRVYPDGRKYEGGCHNVMGPDGRGVMWAAGGAALQVGEWTAGSLTRSLR